MKTSNISYILKMIVFVLIGALLFRTVSVIFLEKNSYGKYRNFRNQENVDILILGSSHSDNGISADRMESRLRKDTGAELSVFNYSIYGMRVEQMYFFMKEILREKTPDLIVLETFAFVPIADADREILARRAFDVFPMSANKAEAIPYCVREDYWSYYLPIMKYHSRWKELGIRDVKMLYDSSMWEKAGKKLAGEKNVMDETDDYFAADTSGMEETEAINDTERECLEKILKLARERGIKILFTSVPFKVQLGMDSLRMIRINNYLKEQYVDGSDVQILDMNRMWRKLDFGYHDLYNEGHCNRTGAKKVTNCLSDYLSETYDVAAWSGGGE